MQSLGGVDGVLKLFFNLNLYLVLLNSLVFGREKKGRIFKNSGSKMFWGESHFGFIVLTVEDA